MMSKQWWVTYHCQDCGEYYPEDCVQMWDETIGPFPDKATAEWYAMDDDSSPVRCVAVYVDRSDDNWAKAPNKELLKESIELAARNGDPNAE